MVATAVAWVGLLAGSTNGELFQALDVDQDGVVTKSEVAVSRQIWFARALRVADSDANGKLTESELESALQDPEPRSLPGLGGARGQRRRMNPKRLDRNNDGLITADEVPKPLLERYESLLDRMDRNSISVDQLETFLDRSVSQGKKNAPKPEDKMKINSPNASRRKGSVGRNAGPANKGRKQSMKKNGTNPPVQDQSGIFDRLDRNGDGFIVQNEAPERMQAAFRRFDTDQDGKISGQEFASAVRRRPRKRRPK